MNEAAFQPWSKLYASAVVELEPTKLIERVDAAEAAIHGRLRDLQYVAQGAGTALSQTLLSGSCETEYAFAQTYLPFWLGRAVPRCQKRGTIMKAGYVWEELYEAAVLETDPEKRSKRLQAAKTAIDTRVQELLLNHGGAPEERHAISKALSAVDMLRREVEGRSHEERL